MKAVWIDQYGGAEQMRYGERPVPAAGPRDLLVAVKAASINPIDWKMREGYLRGVFELAMPYVLGRDFSGEVLAVGPEVEGVAVGDGIFGMVDTMRGGAQAERVAVDHLLVARKPRGIGHDGAAALALVGATAVAALEQTTQIKPGERVLIHGGAGGVGAFAVQLAKHSGAWVAATCSAANRDYVRGLGADQAIDYAGEDFTRAVRDLDLVLDTMGGEIHRRSLGVLKPGGRLVWIAAAPLPPGESVPGITVLRAMVRPDRALFERIAALIDQGAVRPQIGQRLPLAEAVRGYEACRAGTVRGKIVLETAG